jgi:hypothetical protein
MRNIVLSAVVLTAFGFLVGGCSHGTSTDTASTQPAVADVPEIPVPPDSPLAKIQTGMSPEQVVSLIGQPASQGGYATGKGFIPFNYGGDKYRIIYLYKGMGSVIFSQNSSFSSGTSVVEVHYDPNETGIPK